MLIQKLRLDCRRLLYLLVAPVRNASRWRAVNHTQASVILVWDPKYKQGLCIFLGAEPPVSASSVRADHVQSSSMASVFVEKQLSI